MAFNNEASTCLHSFSSIDLQEVYDWVGKETSQEYLTLHQFGSGFFPNAKQHNNNNNLLQGSWKSHVVTIKLEKLVYVYVVSQTQDQATEIYGKDDKVRKITQGSFDHVDFVTVVVNIQNSGWLQVSFYGNFDPDKSFDSTIPGK